MEVDNQRLHWNPLPNGQYSLEIILIWKKIPKISALRGAKREISSYPDIPDIPEYDGVGHEIVILHGEQTRQEVDNIR